MGGRSGQSVGTAGSNISSLADLTAKDAVKVERLDNR